MGTALYCMAERHSASCNVYISIFVGFFCGWVLACDKNTNYKEIALVAFLSSVWFGLQTRAEFCQDDGDKGVTQWYSPDCRLSFLFGWSTHFRENGEKINAAPVELWEIWGLARAWVLGVLRVTRAGRKNHFPCLLRKIIKMYYALDSAHVIACICRRAGFFGFYQHSRIFHSRPDGSHTAAFLRQAKILVKVTNSSHHFIIKLGLAIEAYALLLINLWSVWKSVYVHHQRM